MAGRSPGGGRSQRRRLSRSAEFERVYRQGRSKANRFLVLYAFPRPEAGTSAAAPGTPTGPDVRPATPDSPTGDGPTLLDAGGPRLGLSVSRRVGGAVERSRVKRVLREAFWAEAPRLPAGSDYVVVARPDALGLAERDGMPGMREALAELVDSLGGAAAPEGA